MLVPGSSFFFDRQQTNARVTRPCSFGLSLFDHYYCLLNGAESALSKQHPLATSKVESIKRRFSFFKTLLYDRIESFIATKHAPALFSKALNAMKIKFHWNKKRILFVIYIYIYISIFIPSYVSLKLSTYF